MVPVTSQVGGLVGNDYQMKNTRLNGQLAAGAEVLLDSCVRLHRAYGHPEKIAHASNATIATMPMASIAASPEFSSWSRKGLKPIGRTVNDLQLCLPSSR